MKKNLTLIIFQLFFIGLIGQNCLDYDKAMKAGNAVSKSNYDKAYKEYDYAEEVACTPEQKRAAKQKKDELFKKINQLRESEQKARRDAEAQTKIANEERNRAETQTKIAENQTKVAQTERERAEAQTQIAEAQRDSTEAQRKLAVEQSLKVAKQFRMAQNAAFVANYREREPTLALQTAYYNWQNNPENANTLVDLMKIFSDTALVYYDKNWKSHNDYVKAIAFVDSNKKLFSVSARGSVLIKDLVKNENYFTFSLGMTTSVSTAAISQDGRLIVIGYDNLKPYVIDLNTGKSFFLPITTPFSGTSVAISPDKKTILSSENGNLLYLCDSKSGEIINTLEGHQSPITAVAFSPDGKFAISGSLDKTAILWDLTTYKKIKVFEGHTRFIMSVALSPDGKLALTGSQDAAAIIWDIETGKPLHKLNEHQFSVLSVAFSPNSEWAITSGGNGSALVWNIETGRIKYKLLGHELFEDYGGDGKKLQNAPISALNISTDSKMVATGSRNGSVKTWNLDPKTPLYQFDSVPNAVFLNGENRLLYGEQFGQLKLLDIETGKKEASFKFYSYRELMKISPNNKKLFYGNTLYHLTTGKEIHTFFEHSLGVQSLAFSADNKRLLTGGIEGIVKLWDIEDNNFKLLKTFDAVKNEKALAVSFTNNPQRVMSADGDSLIIWDIATAQPIQRMRLYARGGTAAFSSDYKQIVIGDDDGKVSVLTIETGEKRSFRAHFYSIMALAFSPDGKNIITTSINNEGFVWDVQTFKKWQSFAPIEDARFLNYASNGSYFTCTSVGYQKCVTEIFPTHNWVIKNKIYNFSKKELRDLGVRLELNDLQNLWEMGEKLTAEELTNIGKNKNKGE